MPQLSARKSAESLFASQTFVAASAAGPKERWQKQGTPFCWERGGGGHLRVSSFEAYLCVEGPEGRPKPFWEIPQAECHWYETASWRVASRMNQKPGTKSKTLSPARGLKNCDLLVATPCGAWVHRNPEREFDQDMVLGKANIALTRSKLDPGSSEALRLKVLNPPSAGLFRALQLNGRLCFSWSWILFCLFL